jgi:hypothetical protein
MTYLVAGTLGIIFRVQDAINYYYALLDRANGSARVGVMVNSVGLAASAALGRYAWPGGPSHKLNGVFNLTAVMDSTGFVVYVRLVLAAHACC